MFTGKAAKARQMSDATEAGKLMVLSEIRKKAAKAVESWKVDGPFRNSREL